MDINNIPEMYKDDDIVYHYTTTETALNYILKDKKLRLSPRKNSIDPIENKDDWYSYSDGGYETSSPNVKDKAYKVKDMFKKRFAKTKQVCFCKNKIIKDEEKMTSLPIEKYGFFKPRMWDNYSDKYNGVCLAFSRKELEKEAVKNNTISDDLNYIKINKISEKHKSIDVKEVGVLGTDKYYEQNVKTEEKRLFNKHIDYQGENEFRLCSFTDSEYDYIDISKALKGIFISNLGINVHLLEAFRKGKTSTLLDENIFIINWRKNNISLSSFKKHFELLANLEKDFLKNIN